MPSRYSAPGVCQYCVATLHASECAEVQVYVLMLKNELTTQKGTGEVRGEPTK